MKWWSFKKRQIDRKPLESSFPHLQPVLQIHLNSEKYILLNELEAEIDGIRVPIGYRIQTKEGHFENKTWIELDSLYEENKVKKMTNLVFPENICVLKIENGAVKFGNLLNNYLEQLTALGFHVPAA